MTPDNYLDLLVSFVNDENRNVMILKGKWGVGKTHLWNRMITERKNDINYECVSYVSLFGVSDNQGIIDQIFYKAKYITYAGIRNISRQAYRLAIKSGYANTSKELTKEFEYTTINRYLVCIDDLERKHSSLTLESVLGLTSYLVSENNCKVIIIVNEDNLEDKVELDKYREKVIDYGIEYSPSVRNNASIVFKEDFLAQHVHVFDQIALNNIRIFKLIDNVIKFFSVHVNHVEARLKDDIVKHIILLTYFYYDKNFGVSINSLKTISYSGLLDKQDSNNDQYRKVRQCGYFYTDYDEHILHYLTKGHCDIESFVSYIDALNLREIRSKTREKLHDILNLYNNNFEPNILDLEIQLIEYVNTNIGELNITELNDLLSFMRGVGINIDVESIKNKYVTIALNNNENADFIANLMSMTTDQSILSNINNKLDSIKSKYDIKELVYNIANKQGWGRKDEEALNGFSSNDFYNWLTSEKDSDLLDKISIFIQFANPISDNSMMASIGVKLVEALDNISNLSVYNKYRIDNFINIEKYRQKA